jgi:large subunit ribosomal protein L22
MEFKATAKYIRVSPRKVRLVADSIRKLPVTDALTRLSLTPKHAAEPISKVLESAINNAKSKSVEVDKLKFSRIEIMGGPVLKRWNAVSRGSGHTYKKRMTHIQIILTDKSEDIDAVEENGGK